MERRDHLGRAEGGAGRSVRLIPLPEGSLGRFETRSRASLRMLSRARVAAQSEAVILVTGESGVGKTLLAEVIHEASGRRDGPFVVVDCSSFEETLLCGELFGHARGAFSGAVSRRVGLLEVAEGGTAFLDEIDKLSVGGQSRLLRAIEAKRIRPLGTNREKRLDVRFLSASNRSLPELVRRGEFLSDLYHRISDILLPIPPLRTRPEDVAFLFERFLAGERECLGKDLPRVGEGVWPLLKGHAWPGNVRELRQVARRLAIFAGGRVEEEDVREALGEGDGWEGSSPPAGLREKVRTVEAELIGEALRRSEGNLSRAARALGLSPQALHYKVRRLRVDLGKTGGGRAEGESV